MRQADGVAAFKDVIAPDDAPVVANLRAAGAVIIGRTNTPEFSFRADTDNPLFGRTHNPWGRHVSAGGSIRRRRCLCDGWHRRTGAWKRHWWLSSVSGLCKRAVTVKPGLGRVPRLEPKPNPRKGPMAQFHVGAGSHRTKPLMTCTCRCQR